MAMEWMLFSYLIANLWVWWRDSPTCNILAEAMETHGVAKTYHKEAAMRKGSVLVPVVVSRAILQRQQVINFAFVIKELCEIFKSYCSGGGGEWCKWNCSREWEDTLTT